MHLLGDDYEKERLGPSTTIITTIVAVSVIVLGILIAVLIANPTNTKKKEKPGKQVSYFSSLESPIILESESGSEDISVGSGLHPEDLDFWDKYPEKTIEPEPVEEPEKESETQVETDPSKDGEHTCIKYEDGTEEWVLINPYLPKNHYDYTGLVCQSGVMKYYEDGKKLSFFGTDISKYQDYVDFVKLKKAGIEFVMIRVGARGYSTGQLVLDDYFYENMKRASDAGLEIGLYFFSQAVTEEEAVEEANMVLEAIQDYEVHYPIAYDMEYIKNDEARIDGLTKTEKTQIAKKFLDTVKEAGYIPMLYGSKEWLIKQVDLSKLTAYDIWLSQQEDIPDYPYPFTMWQYKSTAVIDGIAGYADLNISFIDYSEK